MFSVRERAKKTQLLTPNRALCSLRLLSTWLWLREKGKKRRTINYYYIIIGATVYARISSTAFDL